MGVIGIVLPANDLTIEFAERSATCGSPSGESDRVFGVATATDSGRHRASCAPSAWVLPSAQGANILGRMCDRVSDRERPLAGKY